MLARTYEEAMQIYEKYSGNMLGIVSDVSFVRAGEKDKKAGINFAPMCVLAILTCLLLSSLPNAKIKRSH